VLQSRKGQEELSEGEKSTLAKKVAELESSNARLEVFYFYFILYKKWINIKYFIKKNRR